MNQKHVESCRKGSWQVSVQSPPKFRSLYLVKDSGAGSGICLGKSAMRGGCGQVSRLLRFPSWHFAGGELVALPFPWPPTKRLPSAAETWRGRCHGGPEHSRAWMKGKDLLGTRAVLVGHVTAEQSAQRNSSAVTALRRQRDRLPGLDEKFHSHSANEHVMG